MKPSAKANLSNLLSRIEQIETKCREACGVSNPSTGHDWISEVISLLRVTRQQRDDLEHKLKCMWWTKVSARKPRLLGDGVPRRCRMDLLTTPEKSIRVAKDIVEKLGDAPEVTAAVVQLSLAFDNMADYIERTTIT